MRSKRVRRRHGIDGTELGLTSMDCVIIAADRGCYNMSEVVARAKLVFDPASLSLTVNHFAGC